MEFLGLLLPIGIDLINRKIADSDLRFWVSVLVCAAVGVGLNFIDTQFVFPTLREGFDSITASIASVFLLAQLSYKAVWENSKVRKNLDLKA